MLSSTPLGKPKRGRRCSTVRGPHQRAAPRRVRGCAGRHLISAHCEGRAAESAHRRRGSCDGKAGRRACPLRRFARPFPPRHLFQPALQAVRRGKAPPLSSPRALAITISAWMRRHDRTESMLKMARELARHGHRFQMIEAVLEANGFHEAYRFLDQPPIHNELLETADRARRGEGQPITEISPAIIRR
jgi:hypothetical protein